MEEKEKIKWKFNDSGEIGSGKKFKCMTIRWMQLVQIEQIKNKTTWFYNEGENAVKSLNYAAYRSALNMKT